MTPTPHDATRDLMLDDGTRVDVRGGFDGSWSRGFEVVRRTGDRYVVRRRSDGSELPTGFANVDVRRAD